MSPYERAASWLLRRPQRSLPAWLLGVLIAGTVPALAQEAPAEPWVEPWVETGTLSLQLENDLFGSGTDRHYTHGTRISWLTPAGDVPDWAAFSVRWLPFFPRGSEPRVGYSAGQNLYTPADITIAARQPNDRPYAGWLYGALTLIGTTDNSITKAELQIGMVGGSSFAEDTQRLVHKIIGSPEPKGWDYQLEDEPAFVLYYDRKWRALARFDAIGLDADFSPAIGVALGTVHVYGATGAMIRIGRDLPTDFGPPMIRPGMLGSSFSLPARGGFGWYLFAAVEGRAVARNLFLDGSTWRDSPSVDKKTFVGDLQAGAAISISGVRLSYTQIFRTEEFYGQPAGDRYGSFNVSFRF